MSAFSATVDVEIKRVDGGGVLSDRHVLAWLCSGQPYEGRYGAFLFDVCPDPEHDDPDRCDYNCGAYPATYQVTVMGAEPEEATP